MKALFWLVLPLVVLEANAEPILKGSFESQQRQYAVALHYDMIHIVDDAHLEEMVSSGQLVKIPDTVGIKTDERLPENLRYVLPHVADYLIILGRDFYNKFGTEIQINSAVRTIAYQIGLRGRNRNAAPVVGERRTSHTTGATIDIAKLPLTKEQLTWIRNHLVAKEINFMMEATEEHRQAVFHVMIFPEAVAPHIFLAANSK